MNTPQFPVPQTKPETLTGLVNLMHRMASLQLASSSLCREAVLQMRDQFPGSFGIARVVNKMLEAEFERVKPR